MAPTVRDILRLPKLGLTVVAGEAGLDRPIRWAHTSELADPTPWLQGGELLLTTGMGLQGSAALQRAYIRRLARAELAGLGFGVGFSFEEVPATIRRAAEREGFPVLEVPFPVPFIAIAEAVSSRLAQARLNEAQRSLEIHQRLTGLVSDGAGPAEVLKAAVAESGGWALLFDVRGQVVASAKAAGAEPPVADAAWRSIPLGLREGSGAITAEVGPEGERIATPVLLDRQAEAVLLWGASTRFDARHRVLVNHTAAVLGLVLSVRRAVVEAERRLVGEVLGDAFLGRIEGEDLDRRLESLGLSPSDRATALVVACPDASADDLDELARRVDGFLARHAPESRTTVVTERVAALVSHGDTASLAAALVDELHDAGWKRVRVGVGEPLDARALRGSYLAAVFAVGAADDDRPVATPRDAGSWGFLLGSQPKALLEAFAHSVLGPVIEHDERRGSELVPSLVAFIEAGGRWEPGAEALQVHRHTLRYRVRQAEELLGRDLSSAQGRLDVWLALKALQVLREE